MLVTPSGMLSRYLQKILTEELGSTANIFFHKFSSLGAVIDGEIEGEKKPLFSSAPLQDFLLKNILERSGRVNRDVAPALKASLRDAADSLVNPDTVRDIAAEGAFGSDDDTRKIINFFDIYDAYYDEISSVPGYRSYKQFYGGVLSAAQSSAFLASFEEIIFYGFYEFTGTQLELFNQIRSRFKVTFFSPYENRAACAYSKKFFETNLIGSAQNITVLPSANFAPSLFNPEAAPSAETNFKPYLFSAATAEDELFFTAKQILMLVESGKYKFSDIAVTARAADIFPSAERVFSDNLIPLNTVSSRPLFLHPLAVFCSNILNISINNFEKDTVLSIITSPYFAIKNNWRALAETSCAERDWEQWQTLITPKNKFYDPAFPDWLTDVKKAADRLHSAAPWAELCVQANAMLDKFTNAEIFNEEEIAIFASVKAAIRELEKFSLVRPAAKKGEFLEELFYALKTARQDTVSGAQKGVTFADVMSLRGQRFKAVFILGLNDGLFPMPAREDPFLPDRFRRVLRDVCGGWLNEKLERYAEEKMLFYFALSSAKEKLFCSCHKGEGGGAESLYFVELARAFSMDIKKDIFLLPQKEASKYGAFSQNLLTKKEFSLLISGAQDAVKLYREAGFDFSGKEKNVEMSALLKSDGPFNAYDGNTAEDAFVSAAKKGFSPTALQALSACPQKYFFNRVLGVKEPDALLSRAALNADDAGTLYHECLEKVYSALLGQDLSEAIILNKFEEVFGELFHAEKYKDFGVYPVAWRVIAARAKETLSAFLKNDFQNMEGFKPAFFETEAEGIYEGVKLKGKIDRIDLRGEEYRIIDYKKSQKGNKTLTQKDIFLKNLLQPLVYLIMTFSCPETRGRQAESFKFLNIENGAFAQTLSVAYAAEELMDKFSAYLKLLCGVLKSGEFFFCEGDHCAFCAFSRVCRKEHGKSRYRAKNSAAGKKIEEFKNAQR